MKKINKCITAAALAAVLMLAGCDNKTENSSDNSSAVNSKQTDNSVSISDKTQSLLDTVEFPEMNAASESLLDTLFGISTEDLSEYSVYICPTGAYPDEFGIFVAKDESKAADIKDKLDARVENQRSTYETYTPDEMYKLDNCFVKMNGNTVIYAICADNSKAEEILG